MPPAIRLPILLGSVLLSFASPGSAIDQQTAPVVPLARHDLLLDICTAGDRLVAAGEHGVILYSDNDGENWKQASVPTSQMLTGIYFADTRNGWAVGYDGLILFSEDSGENWRIQRDGLAVQQQTNLELHEAKHRELKTLQRELQSAEVEAQPALKLALEDAQLDLEDADSALQEPVFTSPFMDVWFQDSDIGWAVGAFGKFVSTSDGGQHWVDRADELDNPDEYHLNTVTGDNKGRVFIAGEGGSMFRSLDSGLNWEKLEPIYEGSWFGAIYEKMTDTLLVFGLRGNLYRSQNFGTTWEPVPNEGRTSLAGGNASGDRKVVIVGGVGTLLLSTDGGRTFRRNVIPDRLNLSSGLARDDKLILIGQGGVKVREASGHAR